MPFSLLLNFFYFWSKILLVVAYLEKDFSETRTQDLAVITSQDTRDVRLILERNDDWPAALAASFQLLKLREWLVCLHCSEFLRWLQQQLVSARDRLFDEQHRPKRNHVTFLQNQHLVAQHLRLLHDMRREDRHAVRLFLQISPQELARFDVHAARGFVEDS